MKRTSQVTSRARVAGAALVLVLAGCGTQSPSTVTKPYDASDGVGAELADGTVKLRNFLVVGAGKGEPALVVGAITNRGTEAAVVALTADLAETTQPTETRVRVPAGGLVTLGGPNGQKMVIPDLPVAPGEVIGIGAATDGGGTVTLSAPVLAPRNEYGSYLAPTPTPTPSTGPTPTPSATEGDTGEAGTGSGGEPEESATPTPDASATDG